MQIDNSSTFVAAGMRQIDREAFRAEPNSSESFSIYLALSLAVPSVELFQLVE
jgi:hypothetical protein